MMNGIGIENVIPPDDVLKAVCKTIESVGDCLDDPMHAELLSQRKDAQFLRLLGAEFKQRGLPRPTVTILRELHEAGTGESFCGDDAAALHAFDG